MTGWLFVFLEKSGISRFGGSNVAEGIICTATIKIMVFLCSQISISLTKRLYAFTPLLSMSELSILCFPNTKAHPKKNQTPKAIKQPVPQPVIHLPLQNTNSKNSKLRINNISNKAKTQNPSTPKNNNIFPNHLLRVIIRGDLSLAIEPKSFIELVYM